MDYFLSNKEHNYFIIFLCILFLIIITIFKKQITNTSQFYVLIIIILLIIISCLFSTTDLNLKEKFTSINNKKKNLIRINNKECYQRSKEYDDAKKKIDQRLDDFRKFEEEDRFYMKNHKRKLGGEYKKMIELGNYNLDYMANGEDF